MVKRIISARTAGTIDRLLLQVQTDIHDFMHPDTYQLWTLDRDQNWTVSSVEGWTLLGEGTGKLRESGTGSAAGDAEYVQGMVVPNAPYTFRMPANALDPLKHDGMSDPDVTSAYLVINGDRLFTVDAFKTGSEAGLLANAYVTEVHDAPLPRMVAA